MEDSVTSGKGTRFPFEMPGHAELPAVDATEKRPNVVENDGLDSLERLSQLVDTCERLFGLDRKYIEKPAGRAR
jgi:hypothetical protein